MPGLRDYSQDLNMLGLTIGTRGLKRITDHVSYEAKSAVLDRLELDAGEDRAMHGFGRGNWKGKVPGTVKWRYHGQGSATLKYAPPGVWALLESGSKPHVIGAERRSRWGGSELVARARRMNLDPTSAQGVWVTGPIRHPGAKGKRTLTKARARIRRGLHGWVAEAFAHELERAR